MVHTGVLTEGPSLLRYPINLTSRLEVLARVFVSVPELRRPLTQDQVTTVGRTSFFWTNATDRPGYEDQRAFMQIFTGSVQFMSKR